MSEFCSGVLRYERISDVIVSGSILPGFNLTKFEIAHTSNEEFIQSLEDWVFSHPVLKHHVYENLATGAYGSSTPTKLYQYLEVSIIILN